MFLKLPQKISFFLSFILAGLISWITKYQLTPLLFGGLTFNGKNLFIKTSFYLIEVIVVTLILVYPIELINKPLNALGTILKNRIPIVQKLLTKPRPGSQNIVILSIVAILFFVANTLIYITNLSDLPKNGQLQNHDITQLIQIAGYEESENFAFGNYRNPSEMTVIISPDIIKDMRLDTDLIANQFKPFSEIIIDHNYLAKLSYSEFEDLQQSSKFVTWRQISGNLYFYFLPEKSPETYYVLNYEAHIVFLPKQLYESKIMRSY